MGAGTVVREVFVIFRWFAFPFSAVVLGRGLWDGMAGSIYHLSLDLQHSADVVAVVVVAVVAVVVVVVVV